MTHVCAFTGAEVCPPELGNDKLVCPLNLSLASQPQRTVAQTVLRVCYRRGTLPALLGHYPRDYQLLLLAALYGAKECRVEGEAKQEADLLREHLAEIGWPGLAE